MIDKDIIESIKDLEFQDTVVKSFIMISRSGILNAQQDRLLARLSAGSEWEPAEELAQKILKYRADIRALQILQDLGNSFEKEYM